MSDLIIGAGKLAGRGVFAGRDFAAGEVVVPYNLTELSQAEFDALPDGEWEWTHCFWGRIFLFPEPARYVNHDDDPSTFPDLERDGDVALRPIRKGEPITIDDRIELQHELDTFLEAYAEAANSRDFRAVAPLIADDATFWFTDGRHNGKREIEAAFEQTWRTIEDETYALSDVRWVARNYWVSACSYAFGSEGRVDGRPMSYRGHGTSVLRRNAGRWQVVHEQLSR